jgi:hypothetical protein
MADVKFATQHRLNEVVLIDHKALFQIASQASKAADWLRDGPKWKRPSSNLVMADAIPY